MTLIKHSLYAAAIAVASFPSIADSVSSAQVIQSKTNSASVASQKRIDKSAELSIALQAEIEQLEQEVKNLQVYQNHLTALVHSQEEEAASLEKQVEEIKSTRQGIVPLMYQMIDGLKVNLEQDVPIKTVQRGERIVKLEQMMTRADIADAEKYRRILEAYQIELDYGTKLSVYQDQILVDGKALEVDVMHLGRLSLIARSLNSMNYWSWNVASRSWNNVDITLKSELDKAFSIATNQAAPSLINVPVSLVVGGK